MAKGTYEFDYEVRNSDTISYKADSYQEAIALFLKDEDMDFIGAHWNCVEGPDGKLEFNNEEYEY